MGESYGEGLQFDKIFSALIVNMLMRIVGFVSRVVVIFVGLISYLIVFIFGLVIFLIWEVVDNSVDEALAGRCDKIEVVLQADGGCRITDNGAGIPVDIHKQTKKSALETVLTVLHAGGKFGQEGGSYKVSGGLHGVGVSVVNALSSDLIAQVKRDGKLYEQKFKIGKAQGSVKPIGKVDKDDPNQTGTTIIFYPDKSIFETTVFRFKTVLEHLRNQAYLTKNLHFIITDERVNLTYQYYFEGGILSYIRRLNRNKKVRHEPVYIQKSFYCREYVRR
jgi:DNA gyrase subunit B